MAEMIIGTIGALAGGKAADALLNKNAPDGGGIPGLTTSEGGRKDGSQDAIQVDPTIALDYFKQASEAHTAGYNQGLAYYLPALEKAGKEIQQGYAQSNATMKPLSTASGEALNQQLKFLGLDPIQRTAGYGDALRTAGFAINDSLPTLGKYANELAAQMDAATAIRDPEQRAAVKAQIMDKMNNAESLVNQPLQDKITSLKNPTISDQEIDAALSQGHFGGLYNYGNNKVGLRKHYRELADNMQTQGVSGNTTKSKNGEGLSINSIYEAGAGGFNALIGSKMAEQAKLDEQRSAIQKEIDANKEALTQLDPFKTQFDQSYGAEYGRAMTGQEISDAVSNLPGYQFQYEQGAKALERKAASQGLLKSANLELALQEFGQGQAMSYYNNYMNQLSGTIAQGTPATMGIANNQQAQGNSLGQLAQMYGAAQMDTARANADFLSGQLMQSGNLFNNTAMYNAGQQNQAIQNQLNREAEQQKAQTAAAPGYINAQSNASYQQGMLGLSQSKFMQEQQASRNSARGYVTYGGY